MVHLLAAEVGKYCAKIPDDGYLVQSGFHYSVSNSENRLQNSHARQVLLYAVGKFVFAFVISD